MKNRVHQSSQKYWPMAAIDLPYAVASSEFFKGGRTQDLTMRWHCFLFFFFFFFFFPKTAFSMYSIIPFYFFSGLDWESELTGHIRRRMDGFFISFLFSVFYFTLLCFAETFGFWMPFQRPRGDI
jgi:hypothetical protein